MSLVRSAELKVLESLHLCWYYEMTCLSLISLLYYNYLKEKTMSSYFNLTYRSYRILQTKPLIDAKGKFDDNLWSNSLKASLQK